jgi:sulfite exporter TauE/SafE
MQGFLLGLASGTTCLTFCAPVLVPFLLEGKDVRQNLVTLLKFLGGRLGGYMLFGLLAWATGSLLLEATRYQSLVIGAAYVGLAALLLVAVLRKKAPSTTCALGEAQAKLSRWPALLEAGLLPVAMGLLAGLKICPPLLLAFTNAASTGTLAGSLVFFLAFFLGTSIYFIPLSFLGAFAHVSALQIVGKFAAAIVALYYLYAGILLFIGGVL